MAELTGNPDLERILPEDVQRQLLALLTEWTESFLNGGRPIAEITNNAIDVLVAQRDFFTTRSQAATWWARWTEAAVRRHVQELAWDCVLDHPNAQDRRRALQDLDGIAIDYLVEEGGAVNRRVARGIWSGMVRHVFSGIHGEVDRRARAGEMTGVERATQRGGAGETHAGEDRASNGRHQVPGEPDFAPQQTQSAGGVNPSGLFRPVPREDPRETIARNRRNNAREQERRRQGRRGGGQSG